MDVDFGKRSDDYATHRPGFPDSFYRRLATFARLAGAAVVDLGTGPGVIALELAKRGAKVVGVDMVQDRAGLDKLATLLPFLGAQALALDREAPPLFVGEDDTAVAGHYHSGPTRKPFLCQNPSPDEPAPYEFGAK